MTLATSGTMSIGGTTTDRSINVELGRSATATSSMGETDLRSLAGVSSGAISMSNFYGKANYQWVVTVTNQAATIFGQSFQGYGNVGSTAFGSVSDTTCDLYSTNPNWQWYAVNNNATQFFISDTTGTPTGNAGWTFIDVYYNQSNTSGTPNTTVVRSGLSYQQVGSTRIWTMPDSAGSTAGAFSSPTLSPVTLGFR